MGISRDEVCADRIGFIASMGAMEEEIVVYGCCYLEAGKVKYRVSADKNEIYQFVLHAADDSLFPTPVHELMERSLIPAGEEDKILYEVEKKLAYQLKAYYPAEYFIALQPVCDAAPADYAWPLLQQLQERIEGHFNADELQLYERIVLQCSQKKLLTQSKKEQCWAWLQKTRSQMEDDVVVKERYQRTFYGFVYDTASGAKRIKQNMELDRIVEVKLELEHSGAVTGPIVEKTFWFAENSQLANLREQFIQWLDTLCDAETWEIIRQIHQLDSAVDEDAYQQVLAKSHELPEQSQYALDWYAQLWQVKV